jgi:alkyl hydroperoxide reductase subunit AhpC
MITIGELFPQFQICASLALNGSERFTTIGHEQQASMWRIYIFWPRDFTPVCATELVSYGGLLADFAERDAEVIGCSTDSRYVHVAWREAVGGLKNLPIPMLSDAPHFLSTALGILDTREGVAHRATYIVDPSRTIRHITVNDFNVGRNSKETLRVLDALQTDELCPSEWQSGQATIVTER